MIDFEKGMEKQLQKGRCVVEFFARWCGTCRQVSKSMALVEASFDASFFRVDIEKHKDYTESHGVIGVPVVVVYQDGKEMSRMPGSLLASELKAYLESVLTK